MHTWQWCYWQDLPYLTCSLLEPWPHGFFTRHFSPRTPAELVSVLDSEALTYRVRQVHGNRVLNTREVEPVSRVSAQVNSQVKPPELLEADGLLAERSGEAVWVASADCVPVLIADIETGRVSAVHAGWRGTAAQIVPAAIAQFQAQGSQIANLRVALGPAISGEVYQVGQDVAIQLGETVLSDSNSRDQENHTPETLIEMLFEIPDAPVLTDLDPDKVRVDVRRFNVLQLEQLGLVPEQMAIAPHCTYQEPDSFFSYRRDQSKTVQWSGIVNV
ncbi:MAG: peptidoglycan editing factor PgeF [Microcoleaceae cyanobacterium]